MGRRIGVLASGVSGTLKLAVVLGIIALGFAGLLTARNAPAGAASRPHWTEVTRLRSATSETFRGSNGRMRTELHATPIHYRDGSVWRRIDSRLVPTGAGFGTAGLAGRLDGYAYRNAANAWESSFKDVLGPGFLRMRVQGQPLTFSLAGAAPAMARVSGSEIAYPGARPATDLRERVTPSGVKETLVLTSAAAPAHYEFRLEAPLTAGVSGRRLRGGAYAFDVRGGRGSIVVSAPFAIDARRVHAAHGRLVPARDRHANLTVRRERAGWTLAVDVDRRWLASPRRRFPVTVDPSISVQAFKSATWYANCSVCDGWDSGYLDVGPGDGIYRSAVQFDLSGVPSGANITSATLSLDQVDCALFGAPCQDNAHQIDVHRITAPWTTTSVTQAVTFDPTPSASATLPAGAPFGWMTWNLATLVRSWAAGSVANNGVLLKRSTEPAGIGGPSYVGATNTDYDPTLRPKLDVTWASDAVVFDTPKTLHANGAELHWGRFDGSTGTTFDRYEIHRSKTAGFTPSASTLVATIRDVGILDYRDTTAAAGQTFSYKIVTNGTAASNEQRVSLPAAGTATTFVQPDYVSGKDTAITADAGTGQGTCENNGANPQLLLGSSGGFKYRPLVWFDVSSVPAQAHINSATLSLYAERASTVAVTVEAHGITSDWAEGDGIFACWNPGAMWSQTRSDIPWQSPGGDFDAATAASKVHSASDAVGWDAFDIASLVQKWVNGTASNFGILFKAADESWVNGKLIYYDSSDFVTSPAQRPKLAINYADTAQASGPRVAVSAPSAGSTLSGTATIEAAAGDDGRITGMDFYVDGAPKGSDSNAPYTYSWATTGSADGAHSLTAKATDDAGNVTTSPAVSVTVANSAAPTTAITSHSNTYPQTVKNDGPSAYWRLGETSGTTAADASGNGKTGTYGGTYTLAQAGLLTGDTDKSVAFSQQGTDGKVTAALGAILSGAISAEAWVTSAGVGTAGADDRIVSRNWGSAGGWMLALQKATTGEQRATFAINRSGTVSSASSIVTTGKHYLAGTWDGTTMRLYVDGAQTATATPGAVTLNTTASVYVAQTLDTNATIDEVAVYGKALSAAAVGNHYEVGSGRTPKVTGDVPVTASAADDGTVSKVEFYVDGTRFGETTTSPYGATLKTLDPDTPAYDGTHTLTTKAYDNQGKVTQSSPVDVRVANTAGSRYQVTLSASAAPQSVVWDPSAPSQQASGLTVHVVNASTQTLTAADIVLRYRWLSPDPSVQRTDGPDVTLPANLAPGAATDVTVLVQPPALPDGVDRAQYDLQIDAYERSTSSYFAAKGNPPVDNPVIVNRLLSDDLGLERWFHYEGRDIGAGMQHLVNVANGNSLLRWSPWQEPGVGLASVLDLTYNSLEKKSESPVGNNFSISISSLTRWGNPIDIHPNNADSIAGRSNKYIDIVDGDGTTHRFTGQQSGDGTTYWVEPAGVHLYLRRYSTTDATKAWAFTRPDRVTSFYDDQGYPTSVQDANGNVLSFTETAIAPGDDPGGPKRHITKVTDAAGQGVSPAPNRSWTITYYTKADAKKPQIRGKIKQITEHNGDALRFDYYEDGNLLRITQVGGHKANGAALADRSFVFTYTTSNGDAPAIANAANRVDPDPKTPNESTRLYSVRDPRGHETTFEYLGSGNGADRWKLAARTDRDGKRTTWAYDTMTRTTTQAAPMGRVTTFGYDTAARVTALTNPNNELTTFGWTADNQIRLVTEPTGRTRQYDYDDNGYLTASTDQASHRTELAYDPISVDTGDVSGRWGAGRTIPHISQLRTLTTPRGVATAEATNPTDYEWLFSYDAKGNLLTVADPEDRATNGKVTTYTYNGNGTVSTVTDPNQHATTAETYDANGLLTSVLDAKQQRTKFGYDDAGQLLWLQDANHAASSGGTPETYRTYRYYDSFHRLGAQSQPKSTSQRPGVLIWTGVDYDLNGNLTSEASPHEGTVAGDPGGAATTTHSYDDMDRVLEDVGPDHTVDPAGERTQYRYDDAGRVTRLTSPRGARSTVSDQDFAVDFGYDTLDRVTSRTRYVVDAAGAVIKTLREFACYDIAGDLRSVTTPEAHVSSVTCSPYAGASNTTKLDYFADHRVQQQTDPDGHVSSQTYDENGNPATVTDELRGRPTVLSYNQRDQLTKTVEPFDGGASPRDLTTKRTYDPAGNLQTLTSPRGTDAANGDYVTTYGYDAVDQLTLTTLPKDPATGQLYLHRAFDANGNQTMVSTPVGTSDPSQVPPSAKTLTAYFDPGWVLSLDKPGIPKTTYEYAAEGWQTSRTAVGTDGTSRDGHWSYYPDGTVQSMTGTDKQVNTYTYDENNHLAVAKVVSGAHDMSEPAFDITAKWDGLDRLASTEERRATTSNVKVTSFAYNDDGDVTQEIENAIQGPNANAGRTIDISYTPGDRIDTEYDHGKDSTGAMLADDRRITYHFFDNGWPKDRKVEANGAAFATKQTTDWTWFTNGKLKTLVTKNGAGTVRESHASTYVDGSGRYVDGNPVRDTFRLTGPDAAKPCQTVDCTTDYTYDALARLIQEKRQRGSTTTTTDYSLFDSGNIDTIKVGGVVSRKFTYTGDQLDLESDGSGNPVGRYLYDAFGNLSCVTTGTTDRSVCDTWDDATRSGQLRVHADYDALDRMLLNESYSSIGQVAKRSRYIYDPLNRPATRVEVNRPGTDTTTPDAALKQATTAFTYLGLSNAVTRDRRTSTDTAFTPESRDYGYGADGERLGLTFQRDGNPTRELFYGLDAHGSISQLLDTSGNAVASYGYTAYGDPDSAITDERDPDATTSPSSPIDPTSPYRYADKRLDPGSGTFDMGARRYSSSTAHFLQLDKFQGALADMDLEQDALTQNRYGLAGGNPVSFVENDGHEPISSYNRRGQQRMVDKSGNCFRDCDPSVAANSTSPQGPDWYYQRGSSNPTLYEPAVGNNGRVTFSGRPSGGVNPPAKPMNGLQLLNAAKDFTIGDPLHNPVDAIALLPPAKVIKAFEKLADAARIVRAAIRATRAVDDATDAVARARSVAQAAADRAVAAQGPGRGPVYGTHVHTRFADELEQTGGFKVEQSFKLSPKGVPVPAYRGEAGSVRLDAIAFDGDTPVAIFDLKTGSAVLSEDRIRRIRETLPPGLRDVPLEEIRPSG